MLRGTIMQRGTLHLIGIGGTGMSALARLLLAEGYRVTGSDRDFDYGRNQVLAAKLSRLGMTIYPQNGIGLLQRPQEAVYSTAVEEDNPDRQAARARGIPLRHRSQTLWKLASLHRTVAVAGTCGKTTVAAMIGHILTSCGADPPVALGGVLRSWETSREPGNAKPGRGDLFVFEADESDGSLLNYEPEVAVIGPLGSDHFPLDRTRKLFAAFAARVKDLLVLGPRTADRLAEVLDRLDCRVLIPRPELRRGPEGWEALCDRTSVSVPAPGRFNAENAALAFTVARELGIDPREASRKLSTFPGIRRRLELIGETASGVRVYDDYAHNPDKLTAAWRAVREQTRSRVIGIWQPHGYQPLAGMFDRLRQAFGDVVAESDHLLLLPVYYVGGSVERRVHSETLAAALCSDGIQAESVTRDRLPERTAQLAGPGDSVLLMGARDPELPAVAREIGAALGCRISEEDASTSAGG